VSRGYKSRDITKEDINAIPIFWLNSFNNLFSPSNRDELDLIKSRTGKVKRTLAAELATLISTPLYKPFLPSSMFVLLKQSNVVVNNLCYPFLDMSEAILVWIKSKGYAIADVILQVIEAEAKNLQ